MNVRGVLNFLIGIAIFIAGGWLGQWTFTVNLLRVVGDILHAGMLRAVPAYTVGTYGLSWHVAFFIGCGSSTCVDDIPLEFVLSSDIFLLVVSVLEVIWFWRLVHGAFRQPREGQIKTSRRLA